MKLLISLLVIFATAPAFALNDRALVAACQNAGLRQLETQAQSDGCRLDVRTVRVTGIDNRFYNPSKYVWFAGRAVCAGGRSSVIQKMTQYYAGNCF